MTIHADGFEMFPPTHKTVPQRVVGYGYALCDYVGTLLKREWQPAPSVGLAQRILTAELWGIVEGVLIARPDDIVVNDSLDALRIFNGEGFVTKVSDDFRKRLLTAQLKALEESIEVRWRSRASLQAGVYNEGHPMRLLNPICECSNHDDTAK